MDATLKLADNLIRLYGNLCETAETTISLLVKNETERGEIIKFDNEFGSYANKWKITGIYCEFDHQNTIFVLTDIGEHLPLRLIGISDEIELIVRLRYRFFNIVKKEENN